MRARTARDSYRGCVALMLMAAIAATAGAQTAPPAAQDAPSIGIGCPLDGKTYSGVVTVTGGMTGTAGETYTVVVECFGATHYFQVEPRVEGRPRPGAAPTRAGASFEDPCLPVTAGSHVLKASLWSRSSASPIASKEVRFTVEPVPSDEAKIDEARTWIWGLADFPERSLEDYSLAASKAKRNPQAAPEAAKAADNALWAGLNSLGQKITGYCLLSRYYRNRLDFALERETLLFAARIYDTYRTKAGVHPVTGPTGHPYTPGTFQFAPWHFEYLANAYLRLGDLENGLHWIEEEARWYEDQARLAGRAASDVAKCRDYAASRYWRMGWAQFLLRKDEDALRKAIERSNGVRRG